MNLKSTALFVILAFLCIPAYAQQEEHLAAMYTFDMESGDTIFDLSGNGNNGVFRGDVKHADGKYIGGLKFNGKDAFIEIPDSQSFALTSGLTIAMWIYLESYSTAGGTGVTKETCYKFGTRDNKKTEIRASTAGGEWAANQVYGDTDVPLKEWHHIAGTYDAKSGDAIVYLDGEEDGSGSLKGEIVPNNNVVWIGRGATPFFEGMYDEVAIWNVALNQGEIQQAMKSLMAVESYGKLASKWGKIKSNDDWRKK